MGEHDYNEKVDVYSFGVLLVEMATVGGMLALVQHQWAASGGDPRVKVPQIFKRIWSGAWHPLTATAAGDGGSGGGGGGVVGGGIDPLGVVGGAALASAPASVQALALRCCSHDPLERPPFDEVDPLFPSTR